METRTLVLTRSYQPHEVAGWCEAVGMIFTVAPNGQYVPKVEVVEEYPGEENFIGLIPADRVRDFKGITKAYPKYTGGDLIMQVPAVIRIRTWEGSVKHGVKFSRFNIFMRDNYRCQYCGEVKKPTGLNYDHVTPRNQGGKTVWDNIVASCYKCNTKKAGRTPEQAGMHLIRRPFRPKSLPIVNIRFTFDHAHDIWKPYLPAMESVA
jgi:5-methylcytosine-specific restriction endonuclease McrA